MEEWPWGLLGRGLAGADRVKAVLLVQLPLHQSSDVAGAGSFVLSACGLMPGGLPQL